MKVTKEAKEGQSTLFQWLTNHKLNTHFDFDVKGVGQKFFIDETGELYAVLGPEIKLSDRVTNTILTKPLKRKTAKFITMKKDLKNMEQTVVWTYQGDRVAYY